MRLLLGSLGLSAFLFLGATVVGCGGDDVKDACLSACDAVAECGGADPASCSESCDEAATQVDGTGCEGETSAFYGCIENAGCSVDIETDCESELSDLYSCVLKFCADNPGDDRCGSNL